jgi:hypothetical protein
MPPGGRRGAKAARKWTKEPQLGDLVLARVKGYPPWPAKVLPPSLHTSIYLSRVLLPIYCNLVPQVSRPEDWDHTPTPRKFFVYFYGTKEM